MLGVMANAGIKGTEGGTALRGAFLRLSQEPAAVEKALNRLGVASRDAQGNMRKMPDILTELSAKMKDMGEPEVFEAYQEKWDAAASVIVPKVHQAQAANGITPYTPEEYADHMGGRTEEKEQ